MTEGPGYTVLDRWIAKEDLTAVALIPLTAHRGKTAEGLYWPGDSGPPVLALWWSQQISGSPAVQRIADLCMASIGGLFADPAVYASDCIVNTGANRHRVYPHIDTPYRFPQWERSRDLLAVQFLVPLVEFTVENGATAVVEHTHRYLWTVKDLYRGVYDQWFRDNCRQIQLKPGDILAYNPRLLHSTMPNLTDRDRAALLISVMDRSLISSVSAVDGTWQ